MMTRKMVFADAINGMPAADVRVICCQSRRITSFILQLLISAKSLEGLALCD